MFAKSKQHTTGYLAEVRRPQERPGYRDAGPETKGGEYHGGPKRWTGRGPAPARHIPWPEIFKHHISVIEGHFKMIDMVRKHTVEGSANWQKICSLCDRTQEILRDTKYLSRTFVPPANQKYDVPIGSSSASMYPGYSPADHVYGEAAREAGREAVGEAPAVKSPGEDVEYHKSPENPNFESINGKRKRFDGHQVHSTNGEQASPTHQANGSAQTNGTTVESEKPLFVIDTTPMKVDLPDITDESRGIKKTKHDHEGDLPTAVETEDISAEVDAKLKEKREKKKHSKEKKKRKRDSADAEVSNKRSKSDSAEKSEKKKRKKSESRQDPADSTQTSPAKEDEPSASTEKKKKEKKEKKHKAKKAKTDHA